MTKRLTFLIALLACGVAHAAPIRIAAIVNDDVITTADVSARRDFVIATSEVPDSPDARRMVGRRVLDALINETLEMQEARRLSIEVSDEEIDAAIGGMEKQRQRPPGSLRAFIKERGLVEQTMLQQVRAQLSWNKVVERRLRRSVDIAQDEIARAQVAQAAAPGAPEVRIAAISLPITGPQEEPKVAALAEDLARQLNEGAEFMALAQQLAGTGKAAMNPPVWVPEESLQPGMQQALRTLQPGQVTQPLRSQNSYQLISLLDRRMSKPTPDNTEVAVKQFTVALPAQRTPAVMMEAKQTVEAIQANPGTCEDMNSGAPAGKAETTFVRATYQQMTRDLRGVIEHIGVTEMSEPLLGDQAVLLVMLCERIEPSVSLPDAAVVRREIYNEKLELEAQKALRNLRRDAFIEIKNTDV